MAISTWRLSPSLKTNLWLVSTQTDEWVKLSKHTQTIKVEKKVGASQTMNNSEGFVSSIATKKTALEPNVDGMLILGAPLRIVSDSPAHHTFFSVIENSL